MCCMGKKREKETGKGKDRKTENERKKWEYIYRNRK